jgi:hypothetical protein
VHGKMEAGKLPSHLADGVGYTKTESSRVKNSSSIGGEKAASGAAVAGAD